MKLINCVNHKINNLKIKLLSIKTLFQKKTILEMRKNNNNKLIK